MRIMNDENTMPVVRMARERFTELWKAHTLAACQPDSGDVYGVLWIRYNEDHRHYHTPAHIDFCLAQFDLARHQIDDADAVEMAIWFHDLIYDPGALDNEQQSAERFVQLAKGYLDPVFVESVCKLIVATIPGRTPEGQDEEFVVDIDFSSFASPWHEFKRDCRALRDECVHLTDASFHAAQMKFYQSLLARSSLFYTPFFRERMEQTAIENIGRYMEELRAKGIQ